MLVWGEAPVPHYPLISTTRRALATQRRSPHPTSETSLTLMRAWWLAFQIVDELGQILDE